MTKFIPPTKNKITALAFAILPILITGILAYGANIYYDLDAEKIVNGENSELTQNLTVAGNVGIGTTNPSSRLHVVGADTSTSTVAQIGGLLGTGLVVLNNGNVGVGVIPSVYTFDVNGISHATTIQSSNYVYSNNGAGVFNKFQVGNNDVGAGSYFTLRTNNTEQVRIDSAGNVGIGTTMPIYKLNIAGANAGTDVGDASLLGIVNTDTTANNTIGLAFGQANLSGTIQTVAGIDLVGVSHADGAQSGALAFSTRNAGSWGERLRIGASGNVGIGTAAPNSYPGAPLSLLHVNGQNQVTDSWGTALLTSNGAMGINKGGSLTMGGSYFGTTLAGFGAIAGRKENFTSGNPAGYLQLSYGNSSGSLVEGMRIDSTGNVGIGTTAPAQKLHVGGVSQFGDLAAGISGGFRLPTNNTMLEVRQSSNVSQTGNDVTGWEMVTSSSINRNLYLYNSNAGNTLGIIVQGNVGIGTTTPGAKLDIAAGNLDLDNTINANQSGMITKNGAPFIHDFNYGDNGTTTTDGYNTFVGLGAGNLTMGSTATETWHSSFNTGVGANALFSNTTGYGNSAFGSNALFSNTTGSNNFAMGNNAGRYYGSGTNTNQNSNNSLFIGYDTRANAAGGTNEIVIGASAIGAGSNSVVLGNDSITKTLLKGNVGIGTTAPYNKLDVVGSFGVTGTLGSYYTSPSGNDLIFTRAGRNYIRADNVAGDFGFGTGGRDNDLVIGTTGMVTIAQNLVVNGTGNTTIVGNVGIGTTEPGAKLDIAAGNLDLDNTINANQSGMITKNGAPFIHDFNYGDNGTITTDGYNTFVGSGAGNLTMGSTATETWHSSFNTGVGANALFSNTTGYGNSAFGSNALFSNTTGSNNFAMGNNAGRYYGSGTNTNQNSNNSLFIGYDTRANAAGGTNEIVIGASAIGAGSNSVVLGNDSITKTLLKGNVGIGTTAPTEKLSVLGSDSLATTTVANLSGSTGTGLVVMADGKVGIGATPSTSTFLDITTSVNFPSQIRVLNNANTVAAGASVVVSAYGSIGSLNSYATNYATVPALARRVVLTTDTGSNGLNLAAASATGDMRFMTGGSTNEVMRINSSGNVGIGTTTPGYTLDVNGGFRAGNATSTNALVFDPNTGNVGIGTTTPAGKLTVRGDSSGAAADLLHLENLGAAAIGSGGKLSFINNITDGTATTFGEIVSLATGIGATDYSGALQFRIAANGTLETVAEFGSANIVLNRPLQVNVAGDTGISYDLQFMNTGVSNIVSNGPLTISAGTIYRADNLTLTTRANEQAGDFGTAATTTATTLTDSSKAWTDDEWIGGTITIVAGAGKGQTQTITDNDATVIIVADWDATLGDPSANSVYRLNYAPAGDVLANIANANAIFGGFKVLGNDNGGYAFRVAPDGSVRIGGEGAGESSLFVKQNITAYGGILSLRQLNISEAGMPTATTVAGGSCVGSTGYYYKVTAINGNGETTSTAQFTVTTGAVDSLNTIAWSAVTGATGYKIYRSTENNDWDGDANDQWVDGKVVAAPTTTYDDDCVGDIGSFAPPAANTTGGKLAINPAGVSPTRRFEVLENTGATPQMRIISDASNYAEFYVDATGDLNLKLADTVSGARNFTLLDENMRICAAGDFGSVSCPTTGFSLSGTGNLIVENKVIADKFEQICPEGYVWVPGSAKYGTLPGFCVMKYEAKNVGGAATSQAADAPWTSVSQENARAYCQARGEGYHLISEAEWMTIAENIAATPINDIDAAAGLQLATGHTDNDPSNALPAGTDPAVSACNLRLPLSDAANAFADNCQLRDSGAVYGYSGTGNQWSDTGYVSGGNNKSQLRVHALSNGNTVWDIAGNVWEWTDAIISQVDQPGVNNDGGAGVANWGEWNVAYYLVGAAANSRPPDDGWTGANGIGRLYTYGRDETATTTYRAIRCGGGWYNASDAGVFALGLDGLPADFYSGVGFRCAR